MDFNYQKGVTSKVKHSEYTRKITHFNSLSYVRSQNDHEMKKSYCSSIIWTGKLRSLSLPSPRMQ